MDKFENALVWTGETELFKNADVIAVMCACARMLYHAAFLSPRQRFSVDGKQFIRFRYRIRVDGEHFMRSQIYRDQCGRDLKIAEIAPLKK